MARHCINIQRDTFAFVELAYFKGFFKTWPPFHSYIITITKRPEINGVIESR
jgi:hypothetical protein